MERRELFTNIIKPFNNEKEKIQFIRPPYFFNKTDFMKCINCETKDCKIACDEDTAIIKIQKDGTPIIDISINGCTYCDDCATACKDDVLKIENKKNINAIFSIDPLKCMGWNQTMCFSCKDPCLDDAIIFQGMFKPTIDTDLCTSCGFCLTVCPSDAITFKII